MADTTGLPQVGEIVELEAVGKSGRGTMRFEVIAVGPQAGWMEAKACEALIRMTLSRLQ